MKLAAWAKSNGVSRQTATRWFHAGVLPVADDLVGDMVEVLTSLPARLYGRRSARHRADKALHAAAATGEQAA